MIDDAAEEPTVIGNEAPVEVIEDEAVGAEDELDDTLNRSKCSIQFLLQFIF